MAELERLDIKFAATQEDVPTELVADTLIFVKGQDSGGGIPVVDSLSEITNPTQGMLAVLKGQSNPDALYYYNGTDWVKKMELTAAATSITAGTLTLATGDWSGTTATKTITGLTDSDVIKVSPISKTDATNWAEANIWVTHSGSTVTFAADAAPSVGISVVYEITKGVLS